MGKESGFAEVVERIGGECVAVRLRMVNRVVTAIYDAELRPLGVKASQVNVLTVIGRRGEATPGEVCRLLALEKSSLSRNVERMREKGWLQVIRGEDERSHRLRLSASGKRLLRKVFPAWERAQKEARRRLGGEATGAVGRMADRIWSAAS